MERPEIRHPSRRDGIEGVRGVDVTEDWETIVREHGAMVARVAFRTLGSASDAEDVAQEVFAEAYRFRLSRRVDNWPGLLRRLAAFRSLDALRARRIAPPLDGREPDPGPEPVEEAQARELARALRLALARLPARQAAVFSLSCFEGLARDEIANALEISPEAVSTALFKARRRLAGLLDGHRP